MKRNALQILMTAVLAFAFTGAFAQLDSNAVVGDFVSPTVEATDIVTVGQPIPYFVDPDPYFNPDFAAKVTGSPVDMLNYLRGDKTADVSSSFVWSYTGPTDSIATSGNQQQNYIEYTFENQGNYQILVKETSSVGTCPGGTRLINVTAIAPSSVAFATDAAGTNLGTAAGDEAATFEFCENDARLEDIVRVSFTTAVPSNPSFTLDYTYSVDTTDASGTEANVSVTNFTGATAVNTNNSTLDLTKPTAPFECVTNASGTKVTTTYTYTLNGVNDRISRKSDYLANTTADATAWTLYDTEAGQTLAITVHPAPVTGPIYHISNDWAL